MKSLQLVVMLSKETTHPMHEYVCKTPSIEREVVLEGQVYDGVETIVSYVEGDREAYEAGLAARIPVAEYDITPDDPDGFFLYARQELGEAGTLLFDAFEQETLVIVSPIEFRSDRSMRLTVVGHPEDLQAMLDAFPAGVDVDVLEIGEYSRAVGQPITDRQRSALAVAWEAGYYEIPRKAGIEAVADELDVAVSTVSDLLRRGEARLVSAALDQSR